MTATTGAPRPVVDVRALARKHWWLAVGLVVVTVVAVYKAAAKDTAPAAQPDPVVIEKEAPTTTARPTLDPLAGFSKPLSPFAQVMVGGNYDDRRELARRVNELLGSGLGDCAVYMGSDGVAWSVSAVWSAGYPSPVFAGCPWPPSTPTTATAK